MITKVPCVKCPFCKNVVTATVEDDIITCPNCKKSGPYVLPKNVCVDC